MLWNDWHVNCLLQTVILELEWITFLIPTCVQNTNVRFYVKYTYNLYEFKPVQIHGTCENDVGRSIEYEEDQSSKPFLTLSQIILHLLFLSVNFNFQAHLQPIHKSLHFIYDKRCLVHMDLIKWYHENSRYNL